jgi:hypothetical protein
LIAGLMAAAMGLAATSGISAAPANSAVIGDLATANSHVTTVQYHYRYRSYGGHYRYGSYGHYRYGSRGY